MTEILENSEAETPNNELDNHNESKENDPKNTSSELKEIKSPIIGLKTLSELNGNDNFIIDLDSGIIKPKVLTGPEMLFQKYLKTQAKPKHNKESVYMNILSVENGKLENQKVNVRLDKDVELDHARPGLSHEMLKETLRNQILQQRLEKLKKRFVKSENTELEPEDKDKDHFPKNVEENSKAEEKNDDTSDEEWIEENEEQSEESDCDEEEITEKKKKNKGDGSRFLDEEAIDEDVKDEESSSSDSESSDNDSQINPPTQKKGRILKAFEDSDDEDTKRTFKKNEAQEIQASEQDDKSHSNSVDKNEVNNVQSNNATSEPIETEIPSNSNEIKDSEDLFNSQATDFTFNEPSFSEEINDLECLFDPKQSQTNNDDNLMDLCSGQFTATPSQLVLTNNDFKFSQNNQTTDSQDDFVTQVPDVRDTAEALSNNDSIVTEVVPECTEESSELPNAWEAGNNLGSDLDSVELTESWAKKMTQSGNDELNPNLPAADLLTSQVADLVKDPKVGDSEKLEESQVIRSNKNKFLESTDDEMDESESQKERKLKIKRKKKKKDRQKKLGFSDDEEDESQHVNDQIDKDSSSLDEESEFPELYVDYDSEENEIEVKLTKKDREKVAKNYFENEAELSESDWNSADEDEKGLDKYDSDLADEDEFDQNKLQEEVGRIHARKVMDEDIKNVKKIQDLLFEDEENDGVGRERKFKWKNQTEGFTMDDENARDADNCENAEQEEENEIMWRRMRHEREILINEQSQKVGESENSILLLDQTSQTVTTASTSTLIKRKFQIVRTNSTPIGNLSGNENKFDSPFLIKATTGVKKFNTSSFLSRGEKTLTKIASFMSTKTDDEVTNLSSHGGGNSMSFAPIEKKEEKECKKRKSEGNVQAENANHGNGKKRKVENQRFLLDQLK